MHFYFSSAWEVGDTDQLQQEAACKTAQCLRILIRQLSINGFDDH
jgi:hypothetical protein